MIVYYTEPRPTTPECATFTGYILAVALPDEFPEEAIAELCGVLRVYSAEFEGLNVLAQFVPGVAGTFVLCRGPQGEAEKMRLVQAAVDKIHMLLNDGIAVGDAAGLRLSALREGSSQFPSRKYIHELFRVSTEERAPTDKPVH